MSDITESEFDEAVGNANGPVLVLFTAPAWCVPCQRFEPHWQKAQEVEALGAYAFITVNMGVAPEDTAQHWASKRFNILGVPQVFLFNGAHRGASPVQVKARAVVPLIRELT